MNWEQFKLILLLRWQLTRNQWAKRGGVGGLIAVVITTIAMCLLGVLSLVGGFAGGAFGLREASPMVVMGVWFGLTVFFLFIWMIGLLTELQRSETIDLQRLMHLPVMLGQIFVFNYLASHLTFSIFLAVPAIFGLTIGLVVSRGAAMLLLLPLGLGMIFMVTAWTYCLRGWLAAMMTNPRKRRTIIMFLSLSIVLTAQGPNLYFNVLRGKGKPPIKAVSAESFEKFVAVEKFIPPFWLPVGAQALAEGNTLPAVLGACGCFAIGGLGLRRAYRSTLKFYHGETGGKASVKVEEDNQPKEISAPTKTGSRFLELRIPGVPEQSCALGLAVFRSMLRAPEVKMAFATSFIVTIVVGGSLFFRAAPKIPDAAKPFIVPCALTFLAFTLIQFVGNQFGFDREGFRALVLSPVERRLILLGKNLAMLPIIASTALILIVIISFWVRLSASVVLAGLFQFVTMTVILSLCGNLLSILIPYRIQSGSMKPTKMPGMAMLVMVLCQFVVPLAMFPLFVPALVEFLLRSSNWASTIPINLFFSAAFALLMVFAYWRMIETFGRLLQRRETKILSVVTAEVE